VANPANPLPASGERDYSVPPMGSLRPRLALSLAGAALIGLAPTARAQGLYEERSTTADGLPTDLVKSVARDRFGFVWLATDAGLVRYDGVGFTSYEGAISFPFGKDLLLTRDERLLALGDAGLVEILGPPYRVRFRELFGTAEGPGPQAVSAPKSLYEDRRGRLWVSEPRSIVRVDGEKLVRYELPPSSHSASFLRSYSLAEDGFGTLWAAAQTGGLLRFDEEADRFVPVDIPWPVTVVHQLRAMGGDRLWAATARGLYEIRVREDRRVSGVVQLDDSVQVSCVGRLGPDLVLGTQGLETYVGRIEEGRFVRHDQIHVFLVQDILEEGDHLWMSTDEGLVLLRSTEFEPLRFVDEVLSSYLVSFVQTADGRLYASDRDNVYRLRPDRRRVRADSLLKESTAFLLDLQTDGRYVWATHEADLLEFDGDRLVRRIDIGAYATDIEKDAEGRLWVIQPNGEGVLCLSPDGTRREYGAEAGVPVEPMALDRSPGGGLFVATRDVTRLVLRYDSKRDRFVSVGAELPFAPSQGFNVYDLKADGEGRYWVASTEGLLEVGERSVRRVEVGHTGSSPAAHAVDVGDDGMVWFATTDGVVRLDPATGHHDLFDERAGLPSKLVGVRDLFAAPGGRLTAATARGTARLVRSPRPPPPLPAPMLLDVRVNDEPVEPTAEDLEVPHGGFVTLTFVSPYYERPPRYQVRLTEEESWRPPQSRNELLLAGLDSGDHTLELRAVLPGSHRASGPTTFSFAVGPPWYLTWWALLLAVGAVGVVAWGAVTVKSWQTTRTEHRLRALVDERTRELSEANRLLGERNVEMERFIYTVSHDLKSPLVTISGFIGLLEADMESGRLSEAGDYVTRVKTSAARMARLVDELLEMSRVGRVRNDPERVDANALVAEVTTEMAPRFAEREVETVVQPDLPSLYVDRSRLRQVIQNLLDNALKFLGDQGQPRVEVGGRREDGRSRLFVRDNGMGIDPELHEQAFELFRRLHARVDGTGVGLSLVKRIVEVHGGRVWIESEGRAGRGTTVWLDLPAEPPERDEGR
jgi:signal transduction histidine kinase/ligand-binding sensor domain-containing protein